MHQHPTATWERSARRMQGWGTHSFVSVTHRCTTRNKTYGPGFVGVIGVVVNIEAREREGEREREKEKKWRKEEKKEGWTFHENNVAYIVTNTTPLPSLSRPYKTYLPTDVSRMWVVMGDLAILFVCVPCVWIACCSPKVWNTEWRRKNRKKPVQSKKEEPKKTVKSECCPAAYMLVSDLLLWATVQWRNFRVLHRNTVVGLLQRGESRNNYIVCCLHIFVHVWILKKIKMLVWGLRPLLMPSLFVWCMIDAKEERGTKSDVHITLPEKEWRNQGDLSVMKSLYFSWSPLRLIIRLVNASW